MTDIVERLRADSVADWDKTLCRQAADEIELLRGLVEEIKQDNRNHVDEIERLRHDAAVQEEMADVKIQKNNELISILEKIADLHRGPGSALAQSALDTMEALQE